MASESALPFQLTPFPSERFQVLGLLGQGGMGQVFRARDRHLNRPVALKFLLEREAPERLQRLVREAQFLAALHHPHVAQVYGVGEWEGRACVVMQLIDGPRLDELAPRLSLEGRVRLMIQAIRGVGAAHRHGVIHRDLKPQNILVADPDTATPTAYVVDFGLAQTLDGDSLSRTGSILGSPHYMSPEQADGSRPLDVRSDVYSLGATLYALTTGHPPFAIPPQIPRQGRGGSDETPFQAVTNLPEAVSNGRRTDPPAPYGPGLQAIHILRRVLEEAPTPPRRWVSDLPRDLERIMLRCLEKDPQNRYPSADALANDLEDFLEGRTLNLPAAFWRQRVQAPLARHPRRLALVATLLLATIATASGTAVLVHRDRQRIQVANRFEQAAQTMEAQFWLGILKPQRPWPEQRAALEAWLTLQLEEARRLGPQAKGPAAQLQGRVLLLLGRPREALGLLQQAWTLGPATPGLAQALGMALLGSAEEVSPGLHEADSNPDTTRQVLHLRYLQPAMRLFQQATTLGHPGELPQARLAYLDGRLEEALDRVTRVLQADPWSVEALRLRVKISQRRAEQTADRDGFALAARQTETHLQALLQLGQGDPQSHLLAARWHRYKADRMTFQFGVDANDTLQTGRECSQAALRLDPQAAAPWALMADLWRRQVEFNLLKGASASAVRPLLEASLEAARQALQRDPRDVPAQLARGYSLTLRAEIFPESGAPALSEAAQQAKSALAVDPDSHLALNLEAWIHLLEARRASLSGQSPRTRLAQWAQSRRTIQDRFPGIPDYRLQAAMALEQLALWEARSGCASGTHQGFQDALQRITPTTTQKEPPAWHRVRHWRLMAAGTGLLGGDPTPALDQADACLARQGQGLRHDPMLRDEAFNACYERALVDLERGASIRPALLQLQSQLQSWKEAGFSPAWIQVNQHMVQRLAGLVRLRRHERSDFTVPWNGCPQQGQALSWRDPAVVWALAGAQHIHASQRLQGAARQQALEQGRQQLQIAANLDASLRWTFRQEFTLAASDGGTHAHLASRVDHGFCFFHPAVPPDRKGS